MEREEEEREEEEKKEERGEGRRGGEEQAQVFEIYITSSESYL